MLNSLLARETIGAACTVVRLVPAIPEMGLQRSVGSEDLETVGTRAYRSDELMVVLEMIV